MKTGEVSMNLNRKEFLRTALAMTGLGVVATRIAACGGGGTSNTTGGAGTGGGNTNACADTEPTETIASNHGHTLTVSLADVAAGTMKVYDIQGTSGHTHSVTVSAGSFATLRAGNVLQLTSTNGGGHTHGITLVCAS
jgi:hypothetical protein